jgi:hypothetical protein
MKIKNNSGYFGKASTMLKNWDIESKEKKKNSKPISRVLCPKVKTGLIIYLRLKSPNNSSDLPLPA